LLALASALVAAAHPSLFFGASDVPALRRAAQTTHAAIASHITQVLDQHLNDPAPTQSDYDDVRFLGDQVAVWAFGYQSTGNAAYADKARQQLLTYSGWASWDFGETASQGGPDLFTAHMLLGASVAYDWIHETLSDADRATIAAKIATEAEKVAVYLPNAWWIDQLMMNHNWIDTAGLGMAALALSGEDPRAASWLALAETNLAHLRASIGLIPDGSWHEGIPYQAYGLGMALPFWQAMRHAGADYTDMGLLRGYGRWLLYASIPDSPQQMILPFGDFTHWPGPEVLEISRFVASRFGDGAATAAANRYANKVPRDSFLPTLWYAVFEFIFTDPSVPAVDPNALPLDGSFPDLGAATLHSSWDAGDLALGFKAGVFGGRVNFDRVATGGFPGGSLGWGHSHADDMSFWLFGKGVWLAPEAMGYAAGKSTNYANPANQTAYHNVILVDGTGQLGDVRTSDSEWNNPWFFQRQSSPLFTPTGTADYAIAGGTGAQLFASTLGITRWDRIVVLSRGRYALVRDDIEASAPHAYDWICHFSDGVSVDGSGWVQGIGKGGQSLGVRMLAPQSWTATTGAQTAQLMKNFDPDASTSWVRVRPSSNAAATQFLAALIPVASAGWSSRPAVDRLDGSDASAGAVIAPRSSLEERWIFARAGASGKSAGDLVLTGSQAGMAGRDASGAPVLAVLFGPGRIADQQGARLLLATQSASAIEARLIGTTLAVSGNPIRDFQAYSPAATAATVNGVAANATFESGMVTYPSAALPADPDAGSPRPDAGSPGPDAGPGDLCGNCQQPGDGGAMPPLEGSDDNPVRVLPSGCSHSREAVGWMAVFGGLLAIWRRRRKGT